MSRELQTARKFWPRRTREVRHSKQNSIPAEANLGHENDAVIRLASNQEPIGRWRRDEAQQEVTPQAVRGQPGQLLQDEQSRPVS